jgi:hypothetical protein
MKASYSISSPDPCYLARPGAKIPSPLEGVHKRMNGGDRSRRRTYSLIAFGERDSQPPQFLCSADPEFPKAPAFFQVRRNEVVRVL